MRPSAQQFIEAVGKLGSIPKFPVDTYAREGILESLIGMASTVEQLNWLVTNMLNHSDQWHGVKELRGVFCSRFKPADGVEGTCLHTRGFTPGDCETAHLLEHPRPLSDTEAKRRLSEFGGKQLKKLGDGKAN